MKLNNLFGLAVIIILFISIPCSCRGSVSAEECDGRLVVDFSAAPQTDAEMEWKVYRVADIIDAQHFHLCEQFSVYPIKFDVSTPSRVRSLAYTLSSYISSEKTEPTYVKRSAPAGNLVFENIESGYYLLKADQINDGTDIYSSSPVLVCIGDGTKYGNEWNTDTTVIPKFSITHIGYNDKTMSYSVKVTWESEHDDLSDIIIEFYKDGEFYDKVKINQANDWYYCWTELSPEYNWTVKEKNLPENCYVNYSWDVNNSNGSKEEHVQIFNTFDNNVSPSITTAADTVDNKTYQNKLPQTGINILPIPILAFSGLFLIGAGWYLVRK